MVSVTVPVAAPALAVSVRTLVEFVGFGPKDAVTPLGRFAADSVTMPLKLPAGVTVIVVVPPAPPWVMVTLPGEANKLKLGEDDDPARALISPLPFGLPQPVARS